MSSNFQNWYFQLDYDRNAVPWNHRELVAALRQQRHCHSTIGDSHTWEPISDRVRFFLVNKHVGSTFGLDSGELGDPRRRTRLAIIHNYGGIRMPGCFQSRSLYWAFPLIQPDNPMIVAISLDAQVFGMHKTHFFEPAKVWPLNLSHLPINQV